MSSPNLTLLPPGSTLSGILAGPGTPDNSHPVEPNPDVYDPDSGPSELQPLWTVRAGYLNPINRPLSSPGGSTDGPSSGSAGTAWSGTHKGVKNYGPKSATPSRVTSFQAGFEGEYVDTYASTHTLTLYDYSEVEPTRIETEGSVSLPYVSELRRLSPAALIRSWTNKGVYREHSGFAQHGFTLAGRSGYSYGDLIAFGSFVTFLEHYGSMSNAEASAFYQGRDIRLVLSFGFEGERFWCDVVTFEYKRVVSSSNVSFEWNLTLVTNAPDNDPQGVGIALGAAASHDWVRDISRNVEGFFDGGLGRDFDLSEPNSLLADTLRDVGEGGGMSVPALASYADAYKGPADARDQVSKHTGLLGRGRTTLEWVQAALDKVDRGIDTTWAIYMAWPRTGTQALMMATEMLGLYATVRWYSILRSSYLAILGSQGARRRSPLQGDDAMFYLDNVGTTVVGGVVAIRHVIEHEVNAADVARSVFQDASRWREIAILNGMSDSRTLGDGSALRPGVVLLVPADGSVSSPAEVLGVDLATTSDGDIVATADDYTFVSGVACLGQGLDHRMRTIRGTNKTYPRFGIQDPLRLNPIGAVVTIKTDVYDQLIREPRVRAVTGVSAAVRGSTIAVAYGVVAATGGRVSSTSVAG